MPQLRIRRPRRRGSRGQSLVEFALILPVVLLLTLIAIDFGRVYLGWVNLQNMARVAANYAANHPTAWVLNDATVKIGYQNQIRADAKANNCSLPLVGGVQTAPDPAFSPDTNLGSTADVQLSCTFQILTPLVGSIVGSGGNLTVSARSTFPIKSGLFGTAGGGGPVAPTVAFTGNPQSIVVGASVAFTDNSTGGPTSWLWSFGDGTTLTSQNVPIHTYAVAGAYDVSLRASNSFGSNTLTKLAYITVAIAPPVGCPVPSFIDTSSDAAQGTWTAAGFATTVNFQQGNRPWTIKSQTLTGGSRVPCNSAITVSKN
jgi:PKD repeat protein